MRNISYKPVKKEQINSPCHKTISSLIEYTRFNKAYDIEIKKKEFYREHPDRNSLYEMLKKREFKEISRNKFDLSKALEN